MSPSSVPFCSDQLYSRLITIISPKWPSPPVVQEIAILPSPSHPNIQYDPNSDPPAVGIPKALLLACFLRARTIFSNVKALHGNFDVKLRPDASIDRDWVQAFEATAVILLWEPNHLTAINWRRNAFEQLVRASRASNDPNLEERTLRSELIFLVSLLTSPLSQHAKSSTLWVYRLQILRASEECFKLLIKPGLTCLWRRVDEIWREELKTVMAAGERHAKNYHAWEHARQVWRLFFDDRVRNNCEDETTNAERAIAGVLRESVAHVHQWCLMHPRDISGWAFLVFLLRSARKGAPQLEETVEIMEGIKYFVKKYDWKGESVEWFLMTMEEMKPLG